MEIPAVFEPILRKSLAGSASDIFLTAGKKPVLRKKGEIVFLESPPVRRDDILAFRRAALSAEEDADRDYRQNGSCDAAFTLPDSGGRFRLNFYETANGPAVAVRPIRNGGELNAAELNLPPVVEQLCAAPRGLILITGSTGSGKSTTLAAMINFINHTQRRHILTLEDPIEFLHEDALSLISQREIRSGADRFPTALRAALRENPDVIVIGEMRDAETIRTAVNAALTGHLVISSLHTADTVQTAERIVGMFPEEFRSRIAEDLGLALIGILSQRLLPSAAGAGMIPAVEILLATPSVRKMIGEQDYKGLEDALRRGEPDGMIRFDRAIFQLYRKGLVRLEDAMAAATAKEEFDLLVKGMENGVEAFRNQYGSESEDGAFVDMRQLLRAAVKHGASDLILSCGAPPVLRINGALNPLELPPMTEKDIQRLLLSIITRRQRIEFEETRELDFALAVLLKQNDGSEQRCRFRLNAFYQRGTVGAVARVVNLTVPTPEELNLPSAIVSLIQKKQGLILVTGPTGSGKSTTLASLLDRINRTRQAHIITIEDPIEYVHSNIRSIVEQRELHADTMSFDTALKYALRQNPDVIMVGEMRDVETMAAAITAAETGHLVLATIHTNSAPQTIDRIVDSFPVTHQNQIRLQLAGVILGVLSQRLIPRIAGGRTAAFEVMVGTPPVRANIREGKTHQLQSTIETSAKDGMITLERALTDLVERGEISEDELKKYRVDYKQTQSFR